MHRREVLQALSISPFAVAAAPSTDGIRRLSTKVPELDALLGGGYPCGHFTLVDGFGASGLIKTSGADNVIRFGAIHSHVSPWEPTRSMTEDLLEKAIRASQPFECWVCDDPRLEEYLGWVANAPVPVLLNGWMVTQLFTRHILHTHCDVEIVADKYRSEKHRTLSYCETYVRVVADRLRTPAWASLPWCPWVRREPPDDGMTVTVNW